MRNPKFDLGFLDSEEWDIPVKPPLNEQPERLLVLVEDKLVGIDLMLPVVMELKSENPELEIEFLFIRRGFINKVKHNYVLWEAMKYIGRVSVLIEAGYMPIGITGRLKSAINLLLQVKKALSRPTIIFYRRDFAPFPIWPLAHAARRGGGALFGFPSLSYPMADVLVKELLTQERDRGPQADHHLLQNDRRLIFHPLQKKLEGRHSNAPMIAIGTSRQFPSWINFIEYMDEKHGILDLEGQAISGGSSKHLVLFYPGNHDLPSLAGRTACRDQFVKCLEAIREVDPQVSILIKPHPICDLTDLLHELRVFDDLKIQIVTTHPQILARHAIACLFSNGSSVIDDMYLADVPVIETSLYTEDIVNAAGSLYPNVGRIGCRSRDEIISVLRDIIGKTAELPLPEKDHLYWEKIPRLSGTIWPDATSTSLRT